MPGAGKLWVGSIVIDCVNFERMVDFWKAALGYVFRDPPSADWAILFDPHEHGPNLSFQKDSAGTRTSYWFHLDLYSSDPEGEVRRLLALGATLRQPAAPGTDYTTLADPDGNPFDVIDTRGFEFGQRQERPPKAPVGQGSASR